MSIIKILGIAAGVAAVGLAGLAITNQGNTAETSDDTTDANLKTRIYQVDLETFVEETEKIISTLKTYRQNWKIISADKNEYSADIKIEVPVLFFTDDLEIKVNKKTEADEITVSLRSNSRVGQSDLGENKRHVLQLLKALDEKFEH